MHIMDYSMLLGIHHVPSDPTAPFSSPSRSAQNSPAPVRASGSCPVMPSTPGADGSLRPSPLVSSVSFDSHARVPSFLFFCEEVKVHRFKMKSKKSIGSKLQKTMKAANHIPGMHDATAEPPSGILKRQHTLFPQEKFDGSSTEFQLMTNTEQNRRATWLGHSFDDDSDDDDQLAAVANDLPKLGRRLSVSDPLVYTTPDARLASSGAYRTPSRVGTPSMPMSPSGSALKQHHNGLLSAPGKDGQREIYYVGIIDILQQYTSKKKIAHLAKSIRHSRDDLSTVNPRFYSVRFKDFMSKCIRVATLESVKEVDDAKAKKGSIDKRKSFLLGSGTRLFGRKPAAASSSSLAASGSSDSSKIPAPVLSPPKLTEPTTPGSPPVISPSSSDPGAPHG
eukprot:TRINITY_DN6706_c0_g1_i2.p1 TRINITY_DN6706_c0_g1~~TRINITY_DN6706_c0_g1_i2.p1  ORF type:complete len:393 (-),score=124.22 TRINITY_DN6706_c0_g1_i2:87-1265(-)